MLLHRLAAWRGLQPLLGASRGAAWQAAAGRMLGNSSSSSDSEDEAWPPAAAGGGGSGGSGSSSSSDEAEEPSPLIDLFDISAEEGGLTAEEAAWLKELQRDAAAVTADDGSYDPAAFAALGLPPPDAAVPAEAQRLLQAGVVGAPNAGKSTLVNQLVQAKVSAVSPKTNTTEAARLGGLTLGPSQVVLYDTPGVVDHKHYRNPAHQRRVRSAWTLAADCDLLLFLVDAARELQRPDPRVARLLADSASGAALGMGGAWDPPPAVLVLNKVDAVPRRQRPALLPLSDRLRGLRPFEDVFYISAKDGRGVPELRQFLLDRATPGEWVLEPGQHTDRGEDEQALEAVREQLFLRLHQELPYAITLRLASCLPQLDGSVKVEVDVVVPSQGAKAIVLGAGGAQVAAIGRAAAQGLEETWGHAVHLSLRVRVDKEGR